MKVKSSGSGLVGKKENSEEEVKMEETKKLELEEES